MNTAICLAAALFAATGTASAEPRYDRNLEKAAAEIAASRMGDLRAGFSYRQRPVFVHTREARPLPDDEADNNAGQAARDLMPGLVPAIEAPVTAPAS